MNFTLTLYLSFKIFFFSGYNGYIWFWYIWTKLNWMNLDAPKHSVYLDEPFLHASLENCCYISVYVLHFHLLIEYLNVCGRRCMTVLVAFLLSGCTFSNF